MLNRKSSSCIVKHACAATCVLVRNSQVLQRNLHFMHTCIDVGHTERLTNTSLGVGIHTHIHTYIHTMTYTHTHIYMHTYMYTQKHIHTHTYIDTHTYIHTYIYTYIHTHLPLTCAIHVSSLNGEVVLAAPTYTYIHIHIHTYKSATNMGHGCLKLEWRSCLGSRRRRSVVLILHELSYRHVHVSIHMCIRCCIKLIMF